MGFYDGIIIVSIGLVLPYYTSKMYDFLVEKPVSKKTVKHVHFSPLASEDDEYYKNKHLTMIGLGVFYIIMGIVLSTIYNNLSIMGITLGGLFLLINSILMQWRNFSSKVQIMILSISLFLLIFTGVTMTKFN